MNKDLQDKAMKSMYEIGQERANLELEKLKSEIDAIREESESLGILKKIKYDMAHNEMLKYTVLYQIKEKKEHLKGGMTWKEFCESIGEPDRTVDRILKEIKPIVEAFSANLANLIGMPLSKIRYLGSSVSANLADFDGESIIYEGRKIPITPENKEDIEALIEALKETHQKEKTELQSKLNRLENNKDRIIKEETETLKTERDALIKENQQLKVFDIEDKDPEWSLEQIKVIEKAAHDFNLLCRKFILDDRLDDDLHLQGKVQASMTEARNAVRNLEQLWNERFNSYDDIQ